MTSGVIIFASSLLITYTEPNISSFADGLWWSIVTTTTVGYGDISPSTLLGRIVAIFLMFVGIGLVGMITGSITTFFVKGNKVKNKSIDFIQSQLDDFESLTLNEVDDLIVLMNNLKKQKTDN